MQILHCLRKPLRFFVAVACVAALTSSVHALTTLFTDSFTGTSSTPVNWIYGSNSVSQPVGTGDTFAVNTTSTALTLVDVSPFGTYAAPIIFHTTPPLNFRVTGDKIIQLNADITINNNTPDYRIGLCDNSSATYYTHTNYVALRIFPNQTSNNVAIITSNSVSTVITNTSFSTAQANLTGTHTFALQIDYSASTLTPTIRAYSNGTFLGQVTITANEGIHPNPTGATQATAIRIMAQCNSGSASGGNFTIDNVTVTSFSPGTILLGQLQGSTSVNRLIFGHNLEAAYYGTSPDASPDGIKTGGGVWDPTTATTSPVILSRLINDYGVKSLRYPGGCEAHTYNWKQSVGPIASRGSTNWAFGLDEFLKLCAQLGAEPIITLSDFALPADQMPQNLADLVEYLNAPATAAHPWAQRRSDNGHPEPYAVKYFELGNESMHGNHLTGSAQRVYTAAQYADYATKSIWAMRAVDPTIQAGLVMWPGGAQDVYCQWNTTVLQLAGAAADFAVLHIYAPRYASGDKAPFSESNLMQACMAVGEQIAAHLQEYHDMITETTGRDLPLAVTEYNASFANSDAGVPLYRYSFGTALECADMMRIFLDPDNGIITANYWQLINGYWGSMQVSARPAAEPVTEKAIYPLFKLWGQHFGANLMNVSVTGPRSDFGGERRTYPAQGNTYQPEIFLTTTDITPLINNNLPNLNKSTIPTVTASMTTGSSAGSILQVNLTNFTGNNYPCLATANAPASANGAPCTYALSYEGRFTQTSSDSLLLDLLLEDSRDWTSSMVSAVVGSVSTPTWTTYQGEMNGLPDTTGIATLLSMPAGSKIISGLLEIRNAKLDIYKQPIFPAYNLITSAASVSTDGHTVYMIVFNKSNLHIPMTVNFNGFTGISARRWEVNGPSLATTTGVSEVVSNTNLPLSGGTSAQHIFPAHSMTAIEFTR